MEFELGIFFISSLNTEDLVGIRLYAAKVTDPFLNYFLPSVIWEFWIFQGENAGACYCRACEAWDDREVVAADIMFTYLIGDLVGTEENVPWVTFAWEL